MRISHKGNNIENAIFNPKAYLKAIKSNMTKQKRAPNKHAPFVPTKTLHQNDESMHRKYTNTYK